MAGVVGDDTGAVVVEAAAVVGATVVELVEGESAVIAGATTAVVLDVLVAVGMVVLPEPVVGGGWLVVEVLTPGLVVVLGAAVLGVAGPMVNAADSVADWDLVAL